VNPETLREQLAALHEELRHTRQVDPRSSALLSDVLKDIQRILDDAGPQGSGGTAAARAAPLADRLERAAVKFEADHPRLAASSRRLIDLLGKAGL
jgi:hypothetical protein